MINHSDKPLSIPKKLVACKDSLKYKKGCNTAGNYLMILHHEKGMND